MKRCYRNALIAVLLLASGIVLAVEFGSLQWDHAGEQERDLLFASERAETPRTVDFRSLQGLPAPVLRYFHHVLRDGMPVILTARIVESGEFNMGRKTDDWKRFTAVQYVAPGAPGFLWNARIRLAPFVSVRVRDGYIRGRGGMTAKFLSLFTVVDARNRQELDTAALQRYLAEAVWYPTALLPSQGVRWQAIDDSRARATMTDGRTTVSLEFRFNDAGEATGVYAPGRQRESSGTFRQTPWEGTFGKYEERGGMLVPLTGEAAWLLPGMKLTYWKGTIEKIGYEFSR